MKKLQYTALLILNTVIVFGQTDYIKKNDTVFNGIRLNIIMRNISPSIIGGYYICTETYFRYSPDSISEFGYKNGEVYVSKSIVLSDSVQKVFLKKTTVGDLILYTYKKKGSLQLYFEKDSTFIKIENENKKYQKQLIKELNDCEYINNSIKLVNYTIKSMTRLLSNYDKCKPKPFPHLKYGINVGYEMLKIIPSFGRYSKNIEEIKYFNFNYEESYTAGIFIDIPILVSDFSLETSLNYSQLGYSYNSSSENMDIDIISNISSIRAPILIKYSLPTYRIRPYLNAGMVITYNIKNETTFYKSIVRDNTIWISDPIFEDYILIDKIQLGYCIGGGFEIMLSYRNSLFIESRYYNLNSFKDSKYSTMTGFHFVTGINF